MSKNNFAPHAIVTLSVSSGIWSRMSLSSPDCVKSSGRRPCLPVWLARSQDNRRGGLLLRHTDGGFFRFSHRLLRSGLRHPMYTAALFVAFVLPAAAQEPPP